MDTLMRRKRFRSGLWRRLSTFSATTLSKLVQHLLGKSCRPMAAARIVSVEFSPTGFLESATRCPRVLIGWSLVYQTPCAEREVR